MGGSNVPGLSPNTVNALKRLLSSGTTSGFTASYAGGFGNFSAITPGSAGTVTLSAGSDGSAGSDVGLSIPTTDFVLHGTGLYSVSFTAQFNSGTAAGGGALSRAAAYALVTGFMLTPNSVNSFQPLSLKAGSLNIAPGGEPSFSGGNFLLWTFDDPCTMTFDFTADGTFGTADINVDICIAKLASA